MSGPVTTYVPSSDGVEVAVHDFGGSGRTVLLCHGTGFCGRLWGPMIATLGRRFRCLAIDFRAHGLTGLPPGVGLAWTGMADDVLAVVDRFSPGEPILAVGHSMGGAALILAETARPGTIDRAWTFEPILLRYTPVADGPNAPDIAKGARKRRAEFPSRDEARRRYRSRPPLSLFDERVLDAYLDHGFVDRPDGSIALRCRPEHEAGVFENHNSGAYERAADLEPPFLVAASGDGEGPAEWVSAAAAEYPHLTLVTYPDLTHFGPLQEPDRLAVDASRFLSGDIGSET